MQQVRKSGQDLEKAASVLAEAVKSAEHIGKSKATGDIVAQVNELREDGAKVSKQLALVDAGNGQKSLLDDNDSPSKNEDGSAKVKPKVRLMKGEIDNLIALRDLLFPAWNEMDAVNVDEYGKKMKVVITIPSVDTKKIAVLDDYFADLKDARNDVKKVVKKPVVKTVAKATAKKAAKSTNVPVGRAVKKAAAEKAA